MVKILPSEILSELKGISEETQDSEVIMPNIKEGIECKKELFYQF